jgi:hypothetical protein
MVKLLITGLLVGIVAGLVGALCGVGGGIIMVPGFCDGARHGAENGGRNFTGCRGRFGVFWDPSIMR